MKRISVIILFLLTISILCMGGENIMSTAQDSIIYRGYIESAKKQQLNTNNLLVYTAKYFLGKPYIASTLERSNKEELTINLREFDCITFIENCIALSLVAKSEDTGYNHFIRMLQNIRYRNGIITDYTSRLHYTSDWIYENEKNGIFKNVTLEIGGEKVPKKINYMTAHPQLYKHLKNNSTNIGRMKEIEKNISSRNDYTILPAKSIRENEKRIKDGDIILFATSIEGLDHSHIGIAYWQGSKLHFIHASSIRKEVVVESKTLSEYCLTSKRCTGITVLRMN